ncbi:MAG: RIP metalloprotease RseP [Spirochaetota bacterium]
MDILFWIIAFVVLGVLIFVHELGHLVMGLITGIKAEVFSIGYGKGIISKTLWGIKFQIGWFPIGGYCKFKGEDPNDKGGSKDDFLNTHPLKRLSIAVGGPAFNYFFAVMLLAALAMLPSTRNFYAPTLSVFENAKYAGGKDEISAAHRAGFRSGDVIISVNKKSVRTDRDVYDALKDVSAFAKDSETKFTVRRGSATVDLKLRGDDMQRFMGGSSGIIIASTTLTIKRVQANSAAQNAGLKAGDTIAVVNGKAVSYYSDFRTAVYDNPGTKITISVRRGKETVTRDVIPATKRSGNTSYGVIGVEFSDAPLSTERTPGKPLHRAIISGFTESASTLTSYVRGLGMLVTGQLPLKDSVGGPIRIMQMTQEVAKTSIVGLINFTAVLSLILFLMNLLPIPIVDGSIIVFSLWEFISRKPLNRALLIRIQMVGFALLVSLGIIITANDIMHIFR